MSNTVEFKARRQVIQECIDAIRFERDACMRNGGAMSWKQRAVAGLTYAANLLEQWPEDLRDAEPSATDTPDGRAALARRRRLGEVMKIHHSKCPRALAWDINGVPCECPRGWPRDEKPEQHEAWCATRRSINSGSACDCAPPADGDERTR